MKNPQFGNDFYLAELKENSNSVFLPEVLSFFLQTSPVDVPLSVPNCVFVQTPIISHFLFNLLTLH